MKVYNKRNSKLETALHAALVNDYTGLWQDGNLEINAHGVDVLIHNNSRNVNSFNYAFKYCPKETADFEINYKGGVVHLKEIRI